MTGRPEESSANAIVVWCDEDGEVFYADGHVPMDAFALAVERELSDLGLDEQKPVNVTNVRHSWWRWETWEEFEARRRPDYDPDDYDQTLREHYDSLIAEGDSESLRLPFCAEDYPGERHAQTWVDVTES